MEFDWNSFSSKEISPKEIEEAFEDPFGIRLMPEMEDMIGRETRCFLLGRSISNRGFFSVFWTDGKRYRVIYSRPMTADEEGFYDRKNSGQN